MGRIVEAFCVTVIMIVCTPGGWLGLGIIGGSAYVITHGFPDRHSCPEAP
jgi:hypothetical protein